MFVAFPGELFAEFALDLKARLPNVKTFVVTLANGCYGYIPTEEAFRHGGYEPRLKSASRFTHDAGSRMVDAAIALIEQRPR